MTRPKRVAHMPAPGVIAEVGQAGRLKGSTKKSYTELIAGFDRWCAAHGLAATPLDEWNLIRFLHARYPRLRAGSAARYKHALVWREEQAGRVVEPMPVLARYLRRLGRDPATPAPKKKAAAMRRQEAVAIGATPPPQPTASTLEVRAAIALMIAGGHTWRSACAVPRAECKPTSTGWVVPDARGVPTTVRDPELTGVLEAALAEREEGPLVPDPRLRWMRFRDVARRLGMVCQPGQVRGGLGVDGLRAMLPFVDGEYARRVRDWAYLTVGLTTALRHASLATIALGDVQPHPEGWALTVRSVKMRPEGLNLVVPHLGDTRTECAAKIICGACAIDRHLAACSALGRREGPLFATFYAGQWRTMTRQNGRLILQSLWQDAGLDPSEKVSTRSLRAGSATTASENGWHLWEIAQYLTHHQSLSDANVYIRRYDPWSWHFHIAPERPHGG